MKTIALGTGLLLAALVCTQCGSAKYDSEGEAIYMSGKTLNGVPVNPSKYILN